VLKPSEFAPHTAAVIGGMIRAAFPDEFIAVVEGGRETRRRCLSKFDTIFFTGSTADRARGDGRGGAPPHTGHLELGGKCPCIVAADAPVEMTARRIVWGKFMNAGQTCVAPDHLWVDRRIASPRCWMR
jgi:aldehyde dehydrogenase (NAD+)